MPGDDESGDEDSYTPLFEGGSLLDDPEYEEAFHDLVQEFSRLLISVPLRFELDKQRALLDDGYPQAAILRQSAFLEFLLEHAIEQKLEEVGGNPLSSKQQDMVSDLGNTPKVRLATTLGLVETENERRVLTQLVKQRNKLAHNWWMEIEKYDEEEYEGLAEDVLEILQEDMMD